VKRLVAIAAAALVAGVLAAGAAGDAPVISVPTNMTVEAQGPDGAIVTYSVDVTSGSPYTLDCYPAPGATFPIGVTNVSCTATNTDTGESSSNGFSITVVDGRPPVIGAVQDISLEATSGAGAVATYTTPTANDVVDGPSDVTCAPASGSTFPVGRSTVTCRSTDKTGNTGSVSFDVVVTDTTPPTLSKVGDVTQHMNGGTATRVDYTTPSATDTVDGQVGVACRPIPHALFKLGTTTVTCTAKDAHGNSATTSFKVTVIDSTPPPTVVKLTARAADDAVTVRWHRPSGSDFVSVVVTRSPGLRGAPSSIVYKGSDTTFTDEAVKAGVKYRYTVVSVDRVGNRSQGAVATAALAAPKKPQQPTKPEAPSPLQPPDGTQVTEPPLLRWKTTPNATYYNVQLYRDGKKVFSTWPEQNRLQLTASWTYGGIRRTLDAGAYRWYVWPGFGDLAAAKYGKLIGTSTFVFAPPA